MTSNPQPISRFLRILCLSAATALAACGTQYGQTGITGGYTDKMIGDDMGVIVISGNGFTSSEKVEPVGRWPAGREKAAA